MVNNINIQLICITAEDYKSPAAFLAALHRIHCTDGGGVVIVGHGDRDGATLSRKANRAQSKIFLFQEIADVIIHLRPTIVFLCSSLNLFTRDADLQILSCCRSLWLQG